MLPSEHFGDVPGQGPARLWTLTSRSGVRVQLSDWGATLVRLQVPVPMTNSHAPLRDLVLGFPTLAGYLADHPHVGCVVGRVANRIRGAAFTLAGTTHQLAKDAKGVHLHGGPKGLHRQLWHGKPVQEPGRKGVRFDLRSAAGAMGYPGTLDASATWWLSDRGELELELSASSNQATPVNLAQHAYFNLGSNHQAGGILDHRLHLLADRVTPMAADMLPTGEVLPVAGTVFDHLQPRALAAAIASDHPQILLAGGLDHNMVRRDFDPNTPEPTLMGWLEAGDGSLRMTLHSTRPCVQLYSSNSLDGSLRDHLDRAWHQHSALCLETQGWPNAVNQPGFPLDLLQPGQLWTSCTRFSFSSPTTTA